MEIILLLPIGLILTLISGFFIARKVYKTLKIKHEKWAIGVSILTFFISFGSLLFLIGFILINQIEFTR